jgi:hypothetical protein
VTLGLTLLLTVAILGIIAGAVQVEQIHRRSAGRQQCEKFSSVLPSEPNGTDREQRLTPGTVTTTNEFQQ